MRFALKKTHNELPACSFKTRLLRAPSNPAPGLHFQSSNWRITASNPSFRTVLKMLTALDLRLHVDLETR
jgi:hypothetical protein